MRYKVLGMMSGTSLDGLDMAYCIFEQNDNLWSFEIKKAVTEEYSPQIRALILDCERCDARTLMQRDFFLGEYFGQRAKHFIHENNLDVDFIASHGQTIFHQPQQGYTTQIGNVNSLAAASGMMVIGDFRSLDVALGGQGAPLVPIGDRDLFSDYPYCLNLGGFSNISYQDDNQRLAYDICPVNMVMNYIASMQGMTYDKDGLLAKSGKVYQPLLQALNDLDLYTKQEKPSLGKEWVEDNVFPLINYSPLDPKDLMATYVEHICMQISKHIGGRCLISGGGAKNSFLIQRLQQYLPQIELFIPDEIIIDYKEALIFAYLGIKRLRGENNCLKSVTGACRDSCSGVIAFGG